MLEKQPRYRIGIDLGTTNSALAWKDTHEKEKPISIFPMAQLVKPGEIEERPLLPSFLYLPLPQETAKGVMKLPWEENSLYAVGEFARRQGSKVPNRLVHSAKSWLCHRGVDRKSSFLPLAAGEEVAKISPVEATTRYLTHMKDAWNHKMGKAPETCLENQKIYLTVPASFDAVARELTVVAAQDAGLTATLLEEPQAAFYSWIAHHEGNWRKILHVRDLILIVDVGGGTTDLSLVSVGEEEGNLILKREAVGDHILLGGDNMDLALAHAVAGSANLKLDVWQSTALWYTCREAKEKLFEDESLKELPLSILGRGSAVVGGTIKTKLTRELLEKTLLEGFFPRVPGTEPLHTAKKMGLSQLQLPYAQESAITKHIAAFLRQNRKEENLPLAVPTAILFNGGVFKAKCFQERTMSVINSWLESMHKPPLTLLPSDNLDLAVAEGAAYYGEVKEGRGIRIRGGAARSYYVGIAGLMPAVPGFRPPMKALCVLPYGMEEGTEKDVPHRELALTVGETVEFPFFSSNERKEDEIGLLLDSTEGLEQHAILENAFPVVSDRKEAESIPVKLHTHLTEIGTLQISCKNREETQEWKLEFNIREN